MIAQPEDFAHRVHARLASVLKARAPNLWVAEMVDRAAAGIRDAARAGVEVRLEHITHNTRSEESESLPCLPLVLERGALRIFLPGLDQTLHAGDRLLFAGRGSARREMLWALSDPDLILTYATGRHAPSGSLGRWLARKRGRALGQ